MLCCYEYCLLLCFGFVLLCACVINLCVILCSLILCAVACSVLIGPSDGHYFSFHCHDLFLSRFLIVSVASCLFTCYMCSCCVFDLFIIDCMCFPACLMCCYRLYVLFMRFAYVYDRRCVCVCVCFVQF